jgi:hypothetical protein
MSEENNTETETNVFDASAEAAALLQKIKGKLSSLPKEKNFKEISTLIDLIPNLKNKVQFETAGVAFDALLSDTPKLSLANEIIKNLKKEKIYKNSSAVWVLLGLLIVSLFAIGFKHLFHSIFVEDIEIINGVKMIFNLNVSLFLNVIIFGAIGSVVSIMVRITEFHQESNVDPIIQVCSGLFKPIIGMAFAVFLLFATKAKFLPIDAGGPGQEEFFFMSLAFLAGFSERLGTDIANKVENKVTGDIQSNSLPKDGVKGGGK